MQSGLFLIGQMIFMGAEEYGLMGSIWGEIEWWWKKKRFGSDLDSFGGQAGKLFLNI